MAEAEGEAEVEVEAPSPIVRVALGAPSTGRVIRVSDRATTNLRFRRHQVRAPRQVRAAAAPRLAARAVATCRVKASRAVAVVATAVVRRSLADPRDILRFSRSRNQW